MFTKRRRNVGAFVIVVLPIVLFYYLDNFQSEMSGHGNYHFYYVIFSSIIALLLGFAAYLEYRKSKVEKIFYISIGLIGVGVFYTYHALVTPNMTIVQLFDFPDVVNNVSVFVLFGDLSRLWLAFMIFIPDNFLEKNQQIKKYFNGYVLVIIALVLTGLGYYSLLNPELLPVFKNADLSDTNFAILTKIITILFIGINVLRYYYSYKAKSNTTILSLIVGLVLIMETVVIFMLSIPWSSTWWLAHNLFLMSYVVIGFGVLYSYFGKEKYGFFDVFGQIEQHTKLLEEKNEELNTIANFDSLTGLSNRRHFMTTTSDYIKEAEKENSTFALMFIDLDYFKVINDNYGHKTGDELLRIFSRKISSLIKSTDMASRVGGDEFVLLIKDVDQAQIHNISNRILERFAEPVFIDGNQCNVGASIGVSIYPNDGTTIDELISKSDGAMYSVKQEGRNNYRIAS